MKLQAERCTVYSATWVYCRWVTMAEKTQTKFAEQQVPVHYTCHTNESTRWRTHVKVKVRISWWFDKTDRDTDVGSVNCRPPDF